MSKDDEGRPNAHFYRPRTSVAEVLQEISGGLLQKKLAQLTADAIFATEQTGKPAEITIKIKLTPSGQSNKMLAILADATAKIPQVPMDPAIYFNNGRGQLTRFDPATQGDFGDPPVRAVETSGASPAEASAESGAVGVFRPFPSRNVG